jgi:hypothetical protein
VFILMTVAAPAASAGLFKLAAAGTISFTTSSDTTIPIGTPWTFDLTYDTAAPDLDAEFGGQPDPTFGKFKNTASPPAPPALRSFHYKAGDYEAAMNDPADFGPFSEVIITFTTVNAIDVNIRDTAFFPPLAGGAVTFHADFNAFSMAPIFTSDALPTNTAIGPASFDQSTVSLLPPAGVIGGSSLTSLTITPILPADFDEDGEVKELDQQAWKGGFGLSAHAAHAQGDADLDNDVDGADFLLWQQQFGMSPAATVPEPTCGLLVPWILFTLRSACAARRP